MRVALLLLGPSALSLRCRGWSVFGRREPPRSVQSLVDHLRRGPSRLDDAMSVVPLTEHECGVQWRGSSRAADDTGGDEDGGREVAFVDRTEFVAPWCGRDTAVGRAVRTYFDAHEDVRRVHSNVLPSIYVAIFLSLTRQGMLPGGTFSPYLRTLPSLGDLQHLPIFWSRRELGELQNSVLRAAVHERKDNWEEEYSIVWRAIAEDCDCHSDFVDRETWFWARSIIMSRAFTDSFDKICLVPYVDMMNHASHAQKGTMKCEWKIDSSGFRLVLPDDDLADTAKRVEISYGGNSNSKFLMNYGFSISHDANQVMREHAMLSLTLLDGANDATESLWEADGLGDCHAISRNITVSIGDPEPMRSVLSLCRVASSQGLELDRMRDNFMREGATTTQTEDGLVPQLGATLCRSPFSVSNEIRAMAMLQQAASDGLRRYGTTLAADDELLRTGWNWRQRLFRRKQHLDRIRNAITVRRGEKQVIHHFYNLASLALRFLRSNEAIDFEQYKRMLTATLDNDEPIPHAVH